jgi:hypothetical protein
MWCVVAMPPYGGFFMAVDPPQKHIFRGALKKIGAENVFSPKAPVQLLLMAFTQALRRQVAIK